MRATRIHINALITCLLLFSLSVFMAWNGEMCGAVGIAGTIGVVAVHFAKSSNGDRDQSCE